MNLAKLLGLNREIAWPPAASIAAATAGSAADYEHVIFVVPNLAALASSGEVGDVPLEALELRAVNIVPEAGITGAATNNFAWNIWHKRAGALLVSTSAPTTISGAGAATVTPASMANIEPGTHLVFAGGTGATETVIVSSVTTTTFTATFVGAHSGGYTITSAPVATVTYASGTNESALVPHQFAAALGTILLPGDILTFARASSNSTGLASPAALVHLDYTAARAAYGRN